MLGAQVQLSLAVCNKQELQDLLYILHGQSRGYAEGQSRGFAEEHAEHVVCSCGLLIPDSLQQKARVAYLLQLLGMGLLSKEAFVYPTMFKLNYS